MNSHVAESRANVASSMVEIRISSFASTADHVLDDHSTSRDNKTARACSLGLGR